MAERALLKKSHNKKYSDIGYIRLLLHPAERKLAIGTFIEQDIRSIR